MLATSMAYNRLKYFHKISSLKLIEKNQNISRKKRGTNNSQKEEIQMANKHVRKSTL